MSPTPQFPEHAHESTAVCGGGGQFVDGGAIELHILATVTVAGRQFARCSCGWHMEFFFQDAPAGCWLHDAEMDAVAALLKVKREIATVLKRSHEHEAELNRLLGRG